MIEKGTTELIDLKIHRPKTKIEDETQGAKFAHKLPFAQKFVQKHLTLSSLHKSDWGAETDSVAARGSLMNPLVKRLSSGLCPQFKSEPKRRLVPPKVTARGILILK